MADRLERLPRDATRELCDACGAGNDGAPYKLDGGPYKLDGGARVCGYCAGFHPDDIAARVRARKHPPAPPAAEFYGEQPPNAKLPLRLPAGTRDVGGGAHDLVRLIGDTTHGWRYVCEDGEGCCWSPPDRIDWRKVRKSPPAPSQAERIPFKVGDWVESDIDGRRFVGRVNAVGPKMTICDGLEPHLQWQNWTSDIRPWTPRPGEMCEGSFGDGGDEIWRGRFSNFDDDNDAWLTDSNYNDGADVCVKGATLRPLAATPPSRDETTGEGSADAATREDAAPAVAGSAQPAAVDKPDPYKAGHDEHLANLQTPYMSSRAREDRITALATNHAPLQFIPLRIDGLTGEKLDAALIENKRINRANADYQALDRLCAARMRSREESGRAERAERHPSDWDVSDAPECFSTSGWGGR